IMQNSYIISLAIGMMIVIITGEIDLSVGSFAALIGAIAGVLLVTHEMPVYLAMIICLVLGALIGAWQGVRIAYFNIPSFIVTLGGMLTFRGLTLVVLGGKPLAPFPDEFRSLSSAFWPDWFNGGDYNIFAIVVGIIASIIFVLNEIRTRKTAIKYDLKRESSPLFITKLVLFIMIINIFSFIFLYYFFYVVWFYDFEYNIFAIVLGIIASMIFVLNEIRTKKTAIKYDLKRASSPLFITKLVLFIMIINIFTFILSQYAGIPYILI